jgi:phosphoenolpyruvate carboxykinase (GTP)
VLEWVFRRCAGEAEAVETAIGLLPTPDDLNTDGLELSDAALTELLTVDEDLYRQAIPQIKEHLAKFGDKLPPEVSAQLDALEQRLSA